ncbi:YpiF family protein [Domibacillus sp. A3M-37]|uniref:YpiF family protein n=2 Tax=Bacillaceae TaxID=186817 RepID=UPI0006180F28|nr:MULTISPECIES: YpiF family protein [Domibacillus]MCP3763188.1 YpiF family protein [Domibacillus sp. A3M-37]
MNWNGKDAALFQQQKGYIDTAIVPLVPADFGADMIRSAEQHEFIGLLVAFLERQFKGRVLVTPPHAYLPDAELKMEGAKQWAEKLRSSGFTHVFFFTADRVWRDMDKDLEAAVIWIPSVPLGDMEDGVKYSLIENQAKQIVNIIVGKWQENEG